VQVFITGNQSKINREASMAYIDEMKQQGNWLFKRRSFLPVIIMSLLVANGLFDTSYLMDSPLIDGLWGLGCFGISLIGLCMRIYTVGYVPHGTSGRTTSEPKARALNTTGMYSIVRHPLYLCNFVIWTGIALFPREISSSVCCVLIFLLFHERIIVAEETFLAEKFGDEFIEWAKKTPALIPKKGLWVKPALRFSWQTVLKREYPGVLTVTLSFTLIDMAINWRREGKPLPDRVWPSILCIGLLVFVAGWILRKTGVTDPPRKQAMET
jgi:protein-S-isoprenylcysteine O-methyltransferase Ste14